MKKLFTPAIFAVVVRLSFVFVRPYWDNHLFRTNISFLIS